MASSLNETNLEKKLNSVTNTQESIQTLSLWCIHHKAHYKKIVEAWLRVIKKAKPSHRLALYYLANDVIQNSKRKGNSSYAEGWKPMLKESVPFVRDEKIKPQIERIFTIWENRSVYGSEFIEELKETLANAKTRGGGSSNAKLLAEFKPQKLVEKIKKYKKLETESELKLKQLSSMKIDVSSSETLRQLKDRALGDKYSREFEDATNKLAEYVEFLGKEVEERASLIEMLEKGETFYDTQRSEAKIVANAYRNFGTRVKNLKKKLDELKTTLPSPVPSPTPDAPSPVDSSVAGSPIHDTNKDNTEAVDMEMSDDEIEGGSLRMEDPDMGTPGSAPSPEGSPDGLNLPVSPPHQTEKETLTSLAGQITQGTNVMTSLLDSMSGSVPALTNKSSLDSRLSNLMQNIPNLSPAMHSGLFGDHSSAMTGLSVPPLMSTSGNDGGGTPLKDEGSGTGSATPLQDEEREASNPVKLLSRIMSKIGGAAQSNLASPLNKGAPSGLAFESVAWENAAKIDLPPKSSSETNENISISEFFKKIGSTFSAPSTSSKQEDWNATNPCTTPQSVQSQTLQTNSSWHSKPPAHPIQPMFEPFNTSRSPALLPIQPTYCSQPTISSSPTSADLRDDLIPKTSVYSFVNLNVNSLDSSESIKSVGKDMSGKTATLGNTTSESLDAISPNNQPSYSCNSRLTGRKLSSDSPEENIYNTSDTYSYRSSVTKTSVDYLSDDSSRSRDMDTMQSQVLSRPTIPKRNPNIVELTPARSSSFNKDNSDIRINNNLITLVQDSSELTFSQMGFLSESANNDSDGRYNSGLDEQPQSNLKFGKTVLSTNLRPILPSDNNGSSNEHNEKMLQDKNLDMSSLTKYKTESISEPLLSGYPSDEEVDSHDKTMKRPLNALYPDINPESMMVSKDSSGVMDSDKVFSRIETVGSRREITDRRKFVANSEYNRRTDLYERRPDRERFPAPGHVYQQQWRDNNWTPRGFQPHFQPRQRFGPPVKRYPPPRMDIRHPYYPPRH